MSELSISRDGGKTWEVIGTVGDFTIADLGVFQEDPAVDAIVLGGGGRFEVSGKMTVSLTCVPSVGDMAHLFGHVPRRVERADRSQPWLKPKKGRGRHL